MERLNELFGGYLAIGAIVIALVAITIAVLVWRKRHQQFSAVFKGVEARLARTKDGAIRIVFDDDPDLRPSQVVRGRAISNHLTFSIYNEEVDAWTFRNLVHHKSGAISLTAHLCSLKPFMAKSYDDYEFEARPRVRFRLKPDEAAIKHALANHDFGQSLNARIESAFREEIASRDDKAVGRERAMIHEGVLKRVRELEETMPLGVEYLEVMSALIKKTHNPYRDYVLARVAAGALAEDRPDAPATTPDAAASKGASRGASRAATPATPSTPVAFGPMDHSVPELDSIRDMFLVDGWTDKELMTPEERVAHFDKANRLFVKTLELQTRQNIAAHLAGAAHVMVLSTDDVGLSRSELLRGAQARAPGGGESNAAAPPRDSQSGGEDET